jgi:large subunit ribosomal protein L3
LLREVELDGEVKVGDKVTLEEVFRKGNLIDVIGTSKGKGFAGVVKRHGFHGGPKTHGQSDRHRAPGSIGSGTTPGRVQKGLKMAGHMGNEQVTVFGLEIMDIDKETGTMLVKGSVPGKTGSSLIIKKSKKKKAAYHEPEIPSIPQIGGGEEEKAETQPEVATEVENTVVEANKEETPTQG